MIGEEYIQKIATCIMLCSRLSLKVRPVGMWEAKWFGVPAVHVFVWGAFSGHQEVSL